MTILHMHPMFIVALFTIVKTWKQPKCPSIDEWIKKIRYIYTEDSSLEFSSVAQSCPSLCNPMNCNTLGLPVHHQLPEFTQLMSIELVIPSDHLILCCPLLLLPSIPPSMRIFSNESALRIRFPKYWSFSFSINPSNEHRGLISLRMNWLDLLAVQGTLKILLQHHSSAIKKNKIMLFTATWVSLEMIMLSEVSQTEKDKCLMISLMVESKI